jgi:hypothetical protein
MVKIQGKSRSQKCDRNSVASISAVMCTVKMRYF